MIRAGVGKMQLKKWTLAFEVKFCGCKKAAETNDLHIP